MESYFTNLSPVVMAVVAVLVFFSLGSWAVIAWKLILIGVARRGSRDFLDFFWETGDFAEIERGLPSFQGSPTAQIFREGYRQTRRSLSVLPENSDATDPPSVTPSEGGPQISGIDSVARGLRKTTGREAERLERSLNFLATSGTVAPFIGLFGTVWGIMIAFRNIGQTGSTSLDVVAPGISEALVTTAIGLVVAIPAVIGFNYLQARIKALVGELEGFSDDFLRITRKSILGEGK